MVRFNNAVVQQSRPLGMRSKARQAENDTTPKVYILIVEYAATKAIGPRTASALFSDKSLLPEYSRAPREIILHRV